jgi:hypothetical protein
MAKELKEISKTMDIARTWEDLLRKRLETTYEMGKLGRDKDKVIEQGWRHLYAMLLHIAEGRTYQEYKAQSDENNASFHRWWDNFNKQEYDKGK